MPTMKNINKLILFFLVLTFTKANAQKTAVYKIDDLTKRIFNNSDTLYVVNFWATWCKPCVAELPEFEKIHQAMTLLIKYQKNGVALFLRRSLPKKIEIKMNFMKAK